MNKGHKIVLRESRSFPFELIIAAIDSLTV